MTSLNSQQAASLEAFIIALEQQNESLPSGLQAQLHAIGQNLENRIMELPTIAASLPNLSQAYQEALANSQTGENESKTVLASTTEQDQSSKLMERAAQIFTSSDPVQAAQKNAPFSGQVAFNPLKRLFGKG